MQSLMRIFEYDLTKKMAKGLVLLAGLKKLATARYIVMLTSKFFDMMWNLKLI